MSNSTNGRFKSKALSFVFSKTLRWMDECEIAIRRAKIAVQWGAQMALHPIYALFQTSRFVGRQLQGAPHHAVKLLLFGTSSPEADVPIQKVVHLLEELAIAVPAIAPSTQTASEAISLASHSQVFIPEAEKLNPFAPNQSVSFWQRLRNGFETLRQGLLVRRPSAESAIAANPTSTALKLHKLGFLTSADSHASEINASRLKIQGVASRLNSRHLVLVVPGNQILDILTPTQQHQLQARITWEIADYGHRRKRELHRKQQVLGITKLVFGDRNSHQRALPKALRALPGQIATLPSRLQNIPRQIWSQSAHLLQALPSPVRERVSSGLFLQPTWNTLKQLPSRFSGLFLLPSRESSDIPRLPGTHALPTFGLMLDFGLLRFIAERSRLRQLLKLQEPSWLTLRDLGGESSTDESQESRLDSIAASSPNESPRSPWNRFFPSLKQFFRQLLQPLRQIWPLVRRQNPILPAVASGQPSAGGRLVQRPQKGVSLRQALAGVEGFLTGSGSPAARAGLSSRAVPVVVATTPEGYEIEFNPNWIEVEATAVGYVKHPLEQILEWIDQVFFWIERTAIAVWDWWVQLFSVGE